MESRELALEIELTRCLRAATRAAARMGERLDLDWVTTTVEEALRGDFGATHARVRLADRPREGEWTPEAPTSLLFPLATGDVSHGVLEVAFPTEPRREIFDVVQTLAAAAASAINDVKLFAREQVAHAEAELAREQLVASERRYRFVVESIPQLVWTAGADGAADFFSGRFLAYTGATRAELEGFAWLHRVRPEQRARVSRELAQATAAGEACELDLELRAADGQYAWFLMHYLPLHDAERRATRWLGTLTDIDARRRAVDIERFLGEASALLASSLDYEGTLATIADLAVPRLADGCIIDIVDDAGVLRRVAATDADPQKRALIERLRTLPLSPDAPVYKFLELCRPQVATQLSRGELAANARSSEHARILAELDPRSGVIAPLRARGKTIGLLWLYQSSSGRAYDDAILGFVEEVASRMALAVDNARLYGDAQIAVRLRDEFLSIASHELKTPLTPLKLQLARLRRDVTTEAAAGKLAVCERQVDRLTRLVSQLLDVSRIHANQLVLEPETFDLVRLVQDVVLEHAREIAHKGSEVRLDAPSEATGHWDRLRIEQVVSNLLSNAVKYGEGKPIDIGISVFDDEVALSVTDHGIGIDDASQARIFGRFERAVSTRHYGGFGLGLWIARTIVEASGGSIEVRSAPGEGSTFTVRLPKL